MITGKIVSSLFISYLLLFFVSSQSLAGETEPNQDIPSSTASETKQDEVSAESDAQEVTELSEELVRGKKVVLQPAPEGSAENGYRVDTTTMGLLGETKLQETPMSVGVVSSAFIENIQAGNTTDALKYSPSVSPTQGSDRSCDYLMIRGFLNKNNTAIDGLRTDSGLGITEDKERIEILSGANSFLSGIASPAGMINYVLKRPTSDPMLKATVGSYGGEQAYAHIDAGGPIDDDNTFGYRLNLLGVNNGSTGVDDESRERYLFSGALDWHLTPDNLLQFDASCYHLNHRGAQAFFFFNDAVTQIPDAPDTSKNYGAPYAQLDRTYMTFGTKLTSKINDTFSVRSAVRYSEWQTERFISMEPVIINNSGDYVQEMMVYNGYTKKPIIQGHVYLDSSFDTGSIKHKATVGYGADHIEKKSTSPGNTFYSFPTTSVLNLSDPAYLSDPNISIDSSSSYQKTQETLRQTVSLGDLITFDEKWSMLIGGAYARIHDKKYSNTTGELTSDYEDSAFTPCVSLMFKPLPAVTTYASYMEALEQGSIAPDSAANTDEQLEPYLSRQFEVGVKSVIGHTNLNLSLFRIEKANAYTDPVTKIYSEDGRQVHTGAELSVTGRVTDNLTLFGGLTVLDAVIKKSSNSAIEGKSPQAVPEVTARLYGEYDIPFITGLTLCGGISYTDEQWVNDENTLSIPYVLLGDVGARYSRNIFGKDTTFRLYVSNVTDEHYWTTFGSDSLNVGTFRTIAFSATVNF